MHPLDLEVHATQSKHHAHLRLRYQISTISPLPNRDQNHGKIQALRQLESVHDYGYAGLLAVGHGRCYLVHGWLVASLRVNISKDEVCG